MNRLSSTRFRLAPRPPILISSSACDMVLALLALRALSAKLLGGPEHRLDDVLVAGAAAQVPRQRPADVLLGWVRVVVQQLAGGQHHAGRAEPALEAVLLPEALLELMQPPAPLPCPLHGQALHRGDLVPVGLD